MSTREHKLKIRAIRTLGVEAESRFICIDEFNPNENCGHYQVGLQVYRGTSEEVNYRRGEEIPFNALNLRTLHHDTVGRSPKDVFENPNMRMYLALNEVLKKNGYVFNKKKGMLGFRKDGYIENQTDLG